MSRSTDTIEVRGQAFDVERSTDHQSGGDVLTVDVEGFDSPIEGRVGYEQEDASFADPRDWSNVGTMAVAYRGYDLGDEDAEQIDFSTACEACEGTGSVDVSGPQTEQESLWWASLDHRPAQYECEACDGSGELALDPAEYFRRERGARVVIGLFVYDHSGITMRAGPTIGARTQRDDVRSTDRFPLDAAGWDTSFVGFIFDTPEGIADCIGIRNAGDGVLDESVTDEEIEAALHGEVEVYASYLEGDVTYYVVIDDETDFHESCGGYVGESEHTEQECLRVLGEAIERRLAERDERAECAARDIETVSS